MTTRRLAAIVAADIAGYSRLMHADEEATHSRFTSLMTETVEPAIAGHGGRIVKLPGRVRQRGGGGEMRAGR